MASKARSWSSASASIIRPVRAWYALPHGNIDVSSRAPARSAAGSITVRAAGMTSLPTPSPGITATRRTRVAALTSRAG